MYLKNHFLIAMPSLDETNFHRSLVFVCEHNKEGAMGLVINSETDLTVSKILEQVENINHKIDFYHANSLEQLVFQGGPIGHERGFVLHPNLDQDNYNASIIISEEVAVTTSRDILSILGTPKEPKHYIVVLGYSGWGAGQLEQEILHNDWLTVPVDPKVLYETPAEDRWQQALNLLGITPAQLSSFAGHA